MKIIKSLVKNLLLLTIILLILSPFLLNHIPAKYISFLTGKLPIVDKFLCSYSTKVAGESMKPIIVPGSSVSLSRCIKEQDLTRGAVVLFNDNSNLRFGIIRHVLPLDPVVYKISNEITPELFHDVIKEEIVGITHDIDISKTKYLVKQNEKSFILNPNEFLSDFYLGKIPKGFGIEMSEVEKTNTFSRANDKFCFVIVPKKKLFNISLEILNTKTQEKKSLGDGIVFDISPKPNINCSDFQSNTTGNTEAIKLNNGIYRYRLLLNHQILKNIQFEVGR